MSADMLKVLGSLAQVSGLVQANGSNTSNGPQSAVPGSSRTDMVSSTTNWLTFSFSTLRSAFFM